MSFIALHSYLHAKNLQPIEMQQDFSAKLSYPKGEKGIQI